MDNRFKLFGELLKKVEDGMKITFTKDNIAKGDRFLIFNNDEDQTTITIHTNRVPYWVEFSNDEPMRLEDCPESFFQSILRNL